MRIAILMAVAVLSAGSSSEYRSGSIREIFLEEFPNARGLEDMGHLHLYVDEALEPEMIRQSEVAARSSSEYRSGSIREIFLEEFPNERGLEDMGHLHLYVDEALEPKMIRQRVAAFKQELCKVNPQDRKRMSNLGDLIKQAKEARKEHCYDASGLGALVNQIEKPKLLGGELSFEESKKLDAHKYEHQLALKSWDEEEKKMDDYTSELQNINSKYPKLTQAMLQLLEEIDDGGRSGNTNHRVKPVKDTIEHVFGVIVRYKY